MMDNKLLLIGGGSGKNRLESMRTMKDIFGVLKGKMPVQKLYVDEHRMFWRMEDEVYRPIALMANRLFPIMQDELIIGKTNEIGQEVENVWPLLIRNDDRGLGLMNYLEYAGFRLLGTNSDIAVLCENVDLRKMVFRDIDFDQEKTWVIDREKWNKDFLAIEDKIGNEFKFPLEINYGNVKDKIVLWENVANIFWRIFEEGYDVVKITGSNDIKYRLIVGFVGRKNFLPSRVVRQDEKGLLIDDVEKSLVRELQNFVINFVKKYEVKDYGWWEINVYQTGWKVRNINFAPAMSRDSMFAKMWNLSGMTYEKMIEKIYSEACENNHE